MSLRRHRRAYIVMGMLTATPQLTGSRDQAGCVALTRDEVMTASEVAELVHLPVSTVYYLARRGSCRRVSLGGLAVPAPADRAAIGGVAAGGPLTMNPADRPDGWAPSHQTEPRRRWIARPPVQVAAPGMVSLIASAIHVGATGAGGVRLCPAREPEGRRKVARRKAVLCSQIPGAA